MTTRTKPAFDVEAAHKHFAAHCFNRAWDLIEKKDRTSEDDRLMVALNQASVYRWLQRPDCGNEQLSVGFWQASRVQSLLGNAAEATRQGEVRLLYSGELKPFYLGYAHEALARPNYRYSGSICGDLLAPDQLGLPTRYRWAVPLSVILITAGR
jgi:hypothetical protein